MYREKVVEFIQQQLESINAKIDFINNPKRHPDDGYYGRDELNMQLGSALFYVELLEMKSVTEISDFEMIYDDSEIYRLIHKYKLIADWNFHYLYDPKTNKISDKRINEKKSLQILELAEDKNNPYNMNDKVEPGSIILDDPVF